MLSDWGLISIANEDTVLDIAPLNQIKVLSYKDKGDWILEQKYNIGKKGKEMPKRSKEYPKPTFSFGDDGVPTIHIGQTIQLLTEDGRDWYASMICKNLTGVEGNKFRMVFELRIPYIKVGGSASSNTFFVFVV